MLIQIHKKLKVDQKFVWVAMVKNGCGQSCHWTLKLNASQKWTDEIYWFFTFGANSGKLKLKVDWTVKNGHGTLNSAVS